MTLTTLSLFVVLVMSLGVVPAYSSTHESETSGNGFTFAQPDFIFRITNIIEDIRLGIASGQDKIELIKEFAHDKQVRIDQALSRGETVSMAIEERRTELLSERNINNITGLQVFREKLDEVAELNTIRILYSQFDECTMSCTELEKQQFNDRVNSLDTWKNKCSGSFDIHDYALSNRSFDDLSVKCPDLKKYSKNHLITAISGN